MKFEINYDVSNDPYWADSGYTAVPMPIDPKQEKGKVIVDAKEFVIPQRDIIIYYDYPLSRTVPFAHRGRSKKGWTRYSLFKAIQHDYVMMYKLEDDPGRVPGMWNRNASEGPYGIWGHYISDLVIESVSTRKQKDGRIAVTLSIGS